jgi:hypothetical protein
MNILVAATTTHGRLRGKETVMKRLAVALLIALFLPVFMGAEDEKPAEKPADKPSSLEESAKGIGGIWIAEQGIKDPKAPHGRFRVEWGVNKKLIRSRTWWVKDGIETQIYEGAQYWHPGRKELVFFEVAASGELYEGVIVEREGAHLSKWTAHSDKGSVEYEQHGEYVDDDTMNSRVYYRKDGELVLLSTYKFHRKPDGWTGDEDKPEEKPAD